MSEAPRVRRPEPARVAPIRNWGTLFGAPMPSAGATQGAAAAVSEGVQMGYKVIEEYMRQGEAAARTVYGPWMGGARGGAQGAPWTQAPWSGGQVPLAPWLELMQSMMGAFPMFWAPPPGEVEGMAGPFTAARQGAAPPTASAPAPASSASTAPMPFGPPLVASAPRASAPVASARPTLRASVQLEVPAGRSAEAVVDFAGGELATEFVVHALRTPDGDGARITGATAVGVAGEDLLRVSVRVPDDIAGGTYSGLIIDRRTSLPRGSVTVVVKA